APLRRRPWPAGRGRAPNLRRRARAGPAGTRGIGFQRRRSRTRKPALRWGRPRVPSGTAGSTHGAACRCAPGGGRRSPPTAGATDASASPTSCTAAFLGDRAPFCRLLSLFLRHQLHPLVQQGRQRPVKGVEDETAAVLLADHPLFHRRVAPYEWIWRRAPATARAFVTG